ncbi:MAG: peroxiredoxin [Dermatophilaceae bacterium]
MALHLGDIAPDFTAASTAGEISFHAWAGDSWVVLFSHPADFTPVCTTELGRVAQLQQEWDRRGVKPIALSVDSTRDHEAWRPQIESFAATTITYPIIADEDRAVANLYDMIHPGEGDTSSVRSVFVIDPAKRVRLSITYPKSVGRNFDEILRAVDALQTTDRAAVSTPVDWRAGERIIVPPTVPTDEARERFDDVEEFYPYLRTARIREQAGA